MLLSAGMILLSGWNPQGRDIRRQAPAVKEKKPVARLGRQSLLHNLFRHVKRFASV